MKINNKLPNEASGLRLHPIGENKSFYFSLLNYHTGAGGRGIHRPCEFNPETVYTNTYDNAVIN
jgi:hypothetical protein